MAFARRPNPRSLFQKESPCSSIAGRQDEALGAFVGLRLQRFAHDVGCAAVADAGIGDDDGATAEFVVPEAIAGVGVLEAQRQGGFGAGEQQVRDLLHLELVAGEADDLGAFASALSSMLIGRVEAGEVWIGKDRHDPGERILVGRGERGGERRAERREGVLAFLVLQSLFDRLDRGLDRGDELSFGHGDDDRERGLKVVVGHVGLLCGCA